MKGKNKGAYLFFLLLGPGQKQTTGDPKNLHQNALPGPWFGLGIMAVRTFNNETKQIGTKHKLKFDYY